MKKTNNGNPEISVEKIDDSADDAVVRDTSFSPTRDNRKQIAQVSIANSLVKATSKIKPNLAKMEQKQSSQDRRNISVEKLNTRDNKQTQSAFQNLFEDSILNSQDQQKNRGNRRQNFDQDKTLPLKIQPNPEKYQGLQTNQSLKQSSSPVRELIRQKEKIQRPQQNIDTSQDVKLQEVKKKNRDQSPKDNQNSQASVSKVDNREKSPKVNQNRENSKEQADRSLKQASSITREKSPSDNKKREKLAQKPDGQIIKQDKILKNPQEIRKVNEFKTDSKLKLNSSLSRNKSPRGNRNIDMSVLHTDRPLKTENITIEFSETEQNQAKRSPHNKRNKKIFLEVSDANNKSEDSLHEDVNFFDEIEQLLREGQEDRTKSVSNNRLSVFQSQVFNSREWPKDSANKKFSYTKMLYERNLRHFREEVDAKQAKTEQQDWKQGKIIVHRRYNLFTTHTGMFICNRLKNKNQQQDEINKKLGLGISIYFKQLKSLILLFIMFSILNLPTLLLFRYGNDESSYSIQDSKNIFSAFTLGNLGQSQSYCLENKQSQSFDLFCQFGVAERLELFAMINSTQTTCSVDGIKTQNLTTLCDLTQNQNVTSLFSKQCYGLKSCTFSVDSNLFPSQCRKSGYNNYIVVYCQENQPIKVPGFKHEFDRSKLSVLVVSLDLVVSIAFVIYISILKRFIKSEKVEYDERLLTITDFAVRVKNLPKAKEFKSLEQLKTMLTLHFNQALQEEKQTIQKLWRSEIHPPEVVQIHFGETSFDRYRSLIKIDQLIGKGRRLRECQKNCTQQENKKIEVQIKKLKDEIVKQKNCYLKTKGVENNEVKCAYVVFRSMEGAARALRVYRKNIFQRFCIACCCRYKEKQTRRMFMGRYLQVDPTIEPSLILWENLGVSWKGRIFRNAITSLVALILVCICLLINLYAKKQDDQLQSFTPQISCSTMSINATSALSDFQKGSNQRGLMYCYCKSVYNSGGDMKQVFNDGGQYCSDWLTKYIMSNYLVYILAFVISFFNYITKLVLRELSSLERQHTVPNQIYSSSINMMVISVVNLAVVVLLVNFKIGTPLPIPILQGSYDDFSVQFYRLVGSAICVQMAFMIVSVNAINGLFQVMFCCKRWKSRNYRLSARHTRQLSQEDYETENIGSDPCMDFKYANLLTVLFVTMMFGSGIPILYLVSALYFLFTYWTDKILIFYYYRKPEQLDHSLAARTLKWFKFALILHLVGGVAMYSNSAILPSSQGEKLSQTKFGAYIVQFSQRFSFFSVYSQQVMIYMIIGVIIIGGYIFWRVFISSIAFLIQKYCKQAKQTYDNTFYAVHDNFYACVNFRTLKQLLADTEHELKRMKKLQFKEQELNSNLNLSELKEYTDTLRGRVTSITTAIQQKAIEHFGQDLTDGKDVTQLQEMMMKEDQKGITMKSLIAGDILSYNLLCNPKYSRLDQIKQILDNQ